MGSRSERLNDQERQPPAQQAVPDESLVTASDKVIQGIVVDWMTATYWG